MTEIKLGDKVRCKITGFTGTAVIKSEFLNGCIQWDVIPEKNKKDNKMPDSVGIDQQSLELVTVKKKLKIEKKTTGGPMRKGINRRNF